MDVAEARHESGGGQEADAGNGAEPRDESALSRQGFQLPFGVADADLELSDPVGCFRQRDTERVGHPAIGVRDEGVDVAHDVVRADRDREADHVQQAPDGVDAGRACGNPGRPHPMEAGDGVLLDRLDGDGPDVLIAVGFEDRLRVVSVDLVAKDVGPQRVGRERPNRGGPGLRPRGPNR